MRHVSLGGAAGAGGAEGKPRRAGRLPAVVLAVAVGAAVSGWGPGAEAAPPARTGPVPGGGPGSEQAAADLVEAEVVRQAEGLGLGDVDRLLEQLEREMEGDLPPIRVRDVIDMLVRREGAYTLTGFLKAVMTRLGREVVSGSGLLGRLVILALLCGLLENIQSAFARRETSQLAFAVCYIVLIIMGVGGFLLATDVCREVIDRLVDFMQAMLPVMITLLASLGAVTTAGLFHPLLVASVEFVAGFIRDVVLPVVLAAACVDLVSRAFTGFQLTALSETLRQAAVVVTGLLLSAFLGVAAIYGAAGAVFDGAAVRAAKFAVGAFIPFVGGLLSDAVEVVASSSLVLKNVVGVVGALAIVAYTVFPLLKVASLVIVFRVAGAVVQPLGAGRLVGSLHSIANSLVLMMVLAFAVGVMFLISLAIVVGAATAAVMAR